MARSGGISLVKTRGSVKFRGVPKGKPGRDSRAMERIRAGPALSFREPYPKPHQVSKVNSLWPKRTKQVREFGKLDP